MAPEAACCLVLRPGVDKVELAAEAPLDFCIFSCSGSDDGTVCLKLGRVFGDTDDRFIS